MNSDTRIANGVAYHLDCEMEGHIVIEQPKTVKLYHKLKYDDQPPAGEYFWAFDMEQFKRQIKDKHLEEFLSQWLDIKQKVVAKNNTQRNVFSDTFTA